MSVSIIDHVNLNHVVKVVSASIFHCKVTIIPLVNIEYEEKGTFRLYKYHVSV